MSKIGNLTILPGSQGHPVSQTLYGIFFEDINFACDGGINANMVNNYSFDGVYYSNEEQKAVPDPLRFWEMEGGTMESGAEEPLHKNSRYASLEVDGHGILSNLGYNGGKAHARECAMAIRAGHTYLFESWMRPARFHGGVRVQVTDASGALLTGTVVGIPLAEAGTAAGVPLTEAGTAAGAPLTEAETAAEIPCNGGSGSDAAPVCAGSGGDGSGQFPNGWQKVSCLLSGKTTGYGKLELLLDGEGTLDLDCVSLLDQDYWHAGDPKWKYGKLRRDLVEALEALHPAFLRFPGGCIVEGQLPGNEYRWKDTVGELYERRSNYNLWSEKLPDGGYNQSYQIGFYEYFCLCEDLHMKPLPTLSVGLNCQIRSAQRREPVCPNIPLGSEAFQREVIDNYLDLIEFANGDPKEGEWAALRARMGHPEPFGLDRIGVGNENYGETYFQRFAAIEEAIHARYPEILCIFCGGVHPYYPDLMGITGISSAYREAGRYPNVLVDEHSYHTPQWFAQQSVRFDGYDRSGPGVYFGEYAANGMLEGMEEAMANLGDAALDGSSQDGQGGMRPMDQSNMLDTALGEAAFLTGVERNSDIVAMTSYAPLFNLVECDQWNHNLINFNPGTLCLSANYYVQQMFSSCLGTVYLPVEGDIPENLYLSATEDEERIYVKVVNVGEEPAELSLSLPADPAEVTVTRLQSEDPQVRNDLPFAGDASYRITPKTFPLDSDGNLLKLEVKRYSVQAVTVRK